MTTENKVQKLDDWCKQLIENFRTEYDKLSKVEKSKIQNSCNYSSPCQIEFFWVNEPMEYQLFITFHDPERNDKEIIINGPYKGYEITDKVISIMNEERWNKKIHYDSKEIRFRSSFDIGDQENKYSDAFLSNFSNFINYLRMETTHNIKMGILSEQIMGGRSWSAVLKGNISELKTPSDLVSKSMEIAKSISSKPMHVSDPKVGAKHTEPTKKDYFKIIGAYFNPPIRIGDQLELSFKDKLTSSIGSQLFYPTIESEFKLGDKIVIFDTFGFIGIQTESKEEAINVLNTIFGVSLFFGVKSLSVRESELVLTKFDSVSKSLSSFTSQISNSNRPMPGSSHHFRQNAISISSMVEILNIAQTVLLNKKLNELLLLLIDSYTHLCDSEYSPSFIFSWFIVEVHISQLFEKMLADKNISNKRQTKYANHGIWSSSTKIEVLNLCDILSDEEYLDFDKYNKKRNDIVHNGQKVNEDEAKMLFELSKEVLNQYISI